MSPVTYIPDFFIAKPDEVFDTLCWDLAWESRSDAPRREYWTNAFGRSYTYGRGAGVRTYEHRAPHPLIDSINALIVTTVLLRTNQIGSFPNRIWPWREQDTDADALARRNLEMTGIGTVTKPFEGCFLNAYKGERDHLGWHADDDPSIDHSRPIAVVTVGAGRAIQFRPVADLAAVEEVFLEPGSLLLMHAGMQATHHHRIPKVGHKVGSRISLTYRGLLP